jgi:hypothetical protein
VKPLTLHQRVDLFNTAFPELMPLCIGHLAGRPFAHGFWFTGGGNVSSFYGSYQTEYLRRVLAMFPDCMGKTEFVHLFSGSLLASENYVRVGNDFTGEYKSDYQIDAHELSSHLPFRPSLIMADPPYSEEDSEHYKCSMVNRPVIIDQCARVLRPGGWLVWQDQALPTFSNDRLRLVGGISYIRSTGNGFRLVSLFQKPANAC